MKNPIKLWFMVLGVGAVIALAFFGWSAKAKDDSTFHLANGVEVTPIEVNKDDTLALLDAKIWKFDVSLPDDTKMCNYTLYLCHQGKIIAQVGGIGSGSAPGESLPSPMRITVCMVPTDADFSAAHQVKYSIRVYGAGSKGLFQNPFRDRFSYTETPQVSPEDNLIYLIRGDKGGIGGSASENAASIALKIEPISVKL